MTKENYVNRKAKYFNVKVEKYINDMSKRYVVYVNSENEDGRYFKTLLGEETAMVFVDMNQVQCHAKSPYEIIMTEEEYVNQFLNKDKLPYIKSFMIEWVGDYRFYNYIAADYEESVNEYYDAAKKARLAAVNYIEGVLSNVGGRIEFDTEQDDEYFSVTYNGGTHPEYDSNICSVCYAVYLKDDEIKLSIEETDEYDEGDVTTNDIIAVADAVKAHVINVHE